MPIPLAATRYRYRPFPYLICCPHGQRHHLLRQDQFPQREQGIRHPPGRPPHAPVYNREDWHRQVNPAQDDDTRRHAGRAGHLPTRPARRPCPISGRAGPGAPASRPRLLRHPKPAAHAALQPAQAGTRREALARGFRHPRGLREAVARRVGREARAHPPLLPAHAPRPAVGQHRGHTQAPAGFRVPEKRRTARDQRERQGILAAGIPRVQQIRPPARAQQGRRHARAPRHPPGPHRERGGGVAQEGDGRAQDRHRQPLQGPPRRGRLQDTGGALRHVNRCGRHEPRQRPRGRQGALLPSDRRVPQLRVPLARQYVLGTAEVQGGALRRPPVPQSAGTENPARRAWQCRINNLVPPRDGGLICHGAGDAAGIRGGGLHLPAQPPRLPEAHDRRRAKQAVFRDHYQC